MDSDTCIWSEETDLGEGLWLSACDNGFVFDLGGPEKNEFLYCPFCGKRIDEAPAPR